MELMHNYQVSFDELLTEKFDCIIAASGYQKRSTYLAENVNFKNSEKLVISYDEPTNATMRLESEKIFINRGFNLIKASPHEGATIERLMHKICSGRTCKNINILIDYSCMTKIWNATIVKFLLKNDFNAERINIYFSYTPKKVNNLHQKSRLKSFEPLIFGSEKGINNKPLTLVAGMNNNHEILKELIGALKPADIFSFIPYFLHDNDYNQKILENNAPILKNIPAEKIFKYPAERPDQISSMLTSLCLDLRLDSNVVLIPHGPKTFSLASILLSVRYPDVLIYDLKSKDTKNEADPGLPAGKPVILKSVFCMEEEDDD
jgi:hypothetical protein